MPQPHLTPGKTRYPLYRRLQFLVKPSNLKIHENPYSRGQVVLCGQTGEEEETETVRHIIVN